MRLAFKLELQHSTNCHWWIFGSEGTTPPAAAVSSGRSDLAKRAVGQPEKLEPGEVSAASMANEKILVTSGCKLVLLDRESKAILWESSGLHGAYSVAVLPAGGFLVGEGKSVAHVDQGTIGRRSCCPWWWRWGGCGVFDWKERE